MRINVLGFVIRWEGINSNYVKKRKIKVIFKFGEGYFFVF